MSCCIVCAIITASLLLLGGLSNEHHVRACRKYNVWEWEDGQQRSEDWKPYSETANKLIIDAAADRQSELSLSFDDEITHSLDLMRMCETNASGCVHRIRGRTELSAFDTDGDGDVDGKELEATMSTSGLGEGLDVEAQVALAKLILAKYDVDASGDLSAEEMSAASTTLDAFLAHHGGGGALPSTSTSWMRVAIACAAVTVGTLMWSWRQKRTLLKDVDQLEAAKNAAQAAHEAAQNTAALNAASFITQQCAKVEAKCASELEAAKNAAQAANSRMSNYVAEMVERVDAAENAAARALQAAQQVVANPQHHSGETNGDSTGGAATKSSTFPDDAAPRSLSRQTTACIAEDFDISLEEAHAALDGAGRNAAVARRAILERLRSGKGGGAVAWEFYDTRVGASPAWSPATFGSRGSWRVFDLATSAKLTDALLEQHDDRCVIERGTVYFRQMVFHCSADGALLRARIRSLPSPKCTPPHWVPQREDEAQLHRVAAGTDEHVYVSSVVQLRAPTARVVAVDRVQDVDLWQRYRVQAGQRAFLNGGDQNERWLFHGTGDAAPKLIWHDGDVGFDARMSSSGYFGNGAYFSESAHYSDKGYCHMQCCGSSRSSCSCSSSGHAQMFVASVICGKTKDYGTRRDSSLKRPPPLGDGSGKLYHSVTSAPDDSDYRMHIVWNNAQAYPRYVVTYETTPGRYVGFAAPSPDHTAFPARDVEGGPLSPRLLSLLVLVVFRVRSPRTRALIPTAHVEPYCFRTAHCSTSSGDRSHTAQSALRALGCDSAMVDAGVPPPPPVFAPWDFNSAIPSAADLDDDGGDVGEASLQNWEWQDDSSWKKYGADDCAKLEAALSTGASVLLTFDDGSTVHKYSVSTAAMKQVKRGTGYERAVRRVGPRSTLQIPMIDCTTTSGKGGSASVAVGGPLAVGDKVRVKASVSKPTYGWGSVRHLDVGTIISVVRSAGTCGVKFDKQGDWQGKLAEMERTGGSGGGAAGHASGAVGTTSSTPGTPVTAANAAVGLRVRRGPAWKWGQQDGGGPGQIMETVSGGWVQIKWDEGQTNSYRTSQPDLVFL